MNYPPPYQDMATLCEHLSLSARTIEDWVKTGKLPRPIDTGGKRLWKWKDVEAAMAKLGESGRREAELDRIREASRQAIMGKPPAGVS